MEDLINDPSVLRPFLSTHYFALAGPVAIRARRNKAHRDKHTWTRHGCVRVPHMWVGRAAAEASGTDSGQNNQVSRCEMCRQSGLVVEYRSYVQRVYGTENRRSMQQMSVVVVKKNVREGIAMAAETCL